MVPDELTCAKRTLVIVLHCECVDEDRPCWGHMYVALLSVTEALRIAKADPKSSILILLDLSAAFDTVNHQIFLSTLSSLGITGIPLRWFESYLTGRSFKVAWGGEEHINWSLGFLRDQFLDHPSSPHTLHHWVPSNKHMVSPTIAMLMTHSSISHLSLAAWRTSRHRWNNITYSSTWQRWSFLISLFGGTDTVCIDWTLQVPLSFKWVEQKSS